MRVINNCFLTVLLLLAMVNTTGCGMYQSINSKYAAELSALEPGTTLTQYRRDFPDALPAGQNSVGGERIDAYQVSHRRYDSNDSAWTTEKLWFYFHNERLVKWGPPGAWPEPADLIIETRSR